MNRKLELSRRILLAGTAGAVGVRLLPGCAPHPLSGEDAGVLGGDFDAGVADGGAHDAGTGPGTDAGTDAGVTPQCLETEDNILGPFYRGNAPFRSTLADSTQGELLIIRGIVRGVGATCVPLAGALLDVWQADDAGDYDNQSPDFRLRGRLYADAQGGYEFQSILPGRYLNGGTYRPRHIHLIVSQPGYVPLTTQLYFEGDPYLSSDPFVRPSLVIPLAQDGNGTWRGTFDIGLAQS